MKAVPEVLVSIALVTWITCSSRAAEARSPSCRRVESEARSTASLLFAPRVDVQLLRLPRTGALDPGEAPVPWTEGYQARGTLSFSPVDVARGFDVLHAADADCDRLTAAESLEEVLQQGHEYGKGEALRAQYAFLGANMARVDELVRDAEARLDRQLTTSDEVEELRWRRLRLERKRSELEQELAFIDAEGAHAADEPLDTVLARYEGAARELEGQRSGLRELAAWDLELRVGTVTADEAEWFGTVSFSFDLGRFWQSGAERSLLASRRDELRESRIELRARVTRFDAGMRQSVAHLREELALVDTELEGMQRRLEDLRRVESVNARARIAAVEIEVIDLRSDQVFLRGLIASREAVLLGRQHDE